MAADGDYRHGQFCLGNPLRSFLSFHQFKCKDHLDLEIHLSSSIYIYISNLSPFVGFDLGDCPQLCDSRLRCLLASSPCYFVLRGC